MEKYAAGKEVICKCGEKVTLFAGEIATCPKCGAKISGD